MKCFSQNICSILANRVVMHLDRKLVLEGAEKMISYQIEMKKSQARYNPKMFVTFFCKTDSTFKRDVFHTVKS